MGADNQADRVIARMEWREELAEIFHRAFRGHQDLAPPWANVSDKHHEGTIAGIAAVLAEINKRINE